jgi:pimeloyl-ACP methyl ester carboxylesterase
MEQAIYCISGLGADEKIFTRLQLKGYELIHIPWLKPHPQEKIEEYAKRMAMAIQHDSPVLVGVSFGGMIGIEIAKQLPLQKLIIVSSIKSANELPQWMRVAGALSLNKLVPMRSYKFTEKIGNNRLGVSTEEERIMVTNYRKKNDPVYLDWAIHQVLNWKNNWHPENIVHIHGDKDRIFPVKKISAHHIIREGTHLMIYNRAEEISRTIMNELTKQS